MRIESNVDDGLITFAKGHYRPNMRSLRATLSHDTHGKFGAPGRLFAQNGSGLGCRTIQDANLEGCVALVAVDRDRKAVRSRRKV